MEERVKMQLIRCRYNEKPLRDINGSALSGVPDMALIDCVVSGIYNIADKGCMQMIA